MSIKTDESLNCPCNGIYKCSFHSPVPMKSWGRSTPLNMMERILDEYNEDKE